MVGTRGGRRVLALPLISSCKVCIWSCKVVYWAVVNWMIPSDTTAGVVPLPGSGTFIVPILIDPVLLSLFV
uniref:Uncharacterized protein n=1 Tax=Cannabis sativa TaxID=3483 RepID=A0A803PK10_CANSA